MSVSLWRILSYMYPGQEDKFRVGQREDGTEYIAYWGIAAPQPTAADIAGAQLEATRALKRLEIKQAAQSEYADRVSTFDGDIVAAKQGVAALTSYEQNVRAIMQDIYDRRETKRQAINAASTVAEIESITWS